MKIILETERLYLREFINSDGLHFYDLNNDFEVVKYTGDAPFKSLEESNDFIKNYSDYKRNGFGRWAVCLKETNNFIGWCGLKYEEEKDETDLGYRFYKKYWRKGYATEAAIACVNYGFSVLKLKKLVGRASLNNVASIEVLKKCGFTYQNKFTYNHQPAVLYSKSYDRN